MWYPSGSSASVWTTLLLAASTTVATPIAERRLEKRLWDERQVSEEMCYWTDARSMSHRQSPEMTDDKIRAAAVGKRDWRRTESGDGFGSEC